MAKLPNPSPMDRHVGVRLAELRESSDVTEARLAGVLGISLDQLKQHESGTLRIEAGQLLEISRFFQVRPSYFFEGVGTDQPGDGPPGDKESAQKVIPLERLPKEPLR
jgi:transcriptional regulator with XRE-family HTH domain